MSHFAFQSYPYGRPNISQIQQESQSQFLTMSTTTEKPIKRGLAIPFWSGIKLKKLDNSCPSLLEQAS